MRPPSRSRRVTRRACGVESAPDGRANARVGRLEVECAVGSLLVVVPDVDAEDMLELAAAEDQEPVEAFAAAGHARRVRDTDDRRRIYVEFTEETRRSASRYYAEHAQLAESLYQRYSEEQIELLLEFVQRSRKFKERKATQLGAQLVQQRTSREGS
jgi:hypothetical protein